MASYNLIGKGEVSSPMKRVVRQHSSSRNGYRVILLSSVLYGTYGVWSRLMGGTFGPFYQAWVRSLIIVCLMLPFMLATKSFRKIERADWPRVSFYIALCVCTQVPLYYAFNHAPIGTVQLIFNSTFVITAYAVGWLYLGERISRIKVVSIILALTGLIVIFGTSALAFAPLGLALAAFNGVTAGGEVSATKKLSDKYSPALLVFWGWVFTFLTHLPLSLLLGEKQVAPRLDGAWLWLLIYAAINATALWIAVVGYRFVDASIGSLIGLMVVISSVAFGVVIFHESLTWSVYAGGALILAASILPSVSRGQRDSLEEPER